MLYFFYHVQVLFEIYGPQKFKTSGGKDKRNVRKIFLWECFIHILLKVNLLKMIRFVIIGEFLLFISVF